MKFLVLAALLALVAADRYAVLMEGSTGMGNYRHQADVYRVYTYLIKSGMPAQNIILLSNDDVVESNLNVHAGHMYQDTAHKLDLYPGRSAISVYRDDVTAKAFLDILAGKDVNGISLKSTSEDTVLVYYSNHGGDGIVAAPHGGYIYANDLHVALQAGHAAGKWKQLVFHLSACHSGSMMVGHESDLEDINTWVMTSANPHESSYAAVFDEDLQAYLMDEYILGWLGNEMLEMLDGGKTLYDLFSHTKSAVTSSHVQLYGAKSLASLPLSEVFGNSNGFRFPEAEDKISAPVATKDVPIALATRSSPAELEEVMFERARWTAIFDVASHAATTASGTPANDDVFVCYKATVEALEAACGRVSETVYDRIGSAKHACSLGTEEKFLEAAVAYCA